MIHYVTHDVMAVTFLIRPTTENWTFDKIKNRKMNEMFVAFNSTKLPPLPTSTTKKKKIKNINLNKFSKLISNKETDLDLESISSDGEIYLNQLIGLSELMQQQEPESGPTNNLLNDKQELNDLNNEHDDIYNDDDAISLLQDQIEPIDVYYISVNDDDETTEQIQRQPRHQRSAQSRNKKNHKYNRCRKKFRFRYTIRRKVHHRFKLHLMRKILRMYQIHFTHVKMDEDNLVIELKNNKSRMEAEHNLAEDIFNSRSYFNYRKLYGQ